MPNETSSRPLSNLPLHRQVYLNLRSSILEGRLAPGERLPSTRRMALERGMSRNTVVDAYEQLVAEGYAVTRHGSGTYVSEHVPASGTARRETQAQVHPRWSAAATRIGRLQPKLFRQNLPQQPRYDFRYGEPAYADLPMDTWARLIGKTARRLTARQLTYGPPAGDESLRRAIAGYLRRARGVDCDPQQVLVVHGTSEAIDLCSRLLVDPGDLAVLEDPHYRGFERVLTAHGADIRYVQVDDDGLCVDQLSAIQRAAMCFLTPSHQFPLGGVLTIDRRLTLLQWARRNRTLLFEDDYDGEFRYINRPVPCLQSLDRSGTVIYAGTASKLLFPALRIGWMVLPPALMPRFERAKAVADATVPTVEQLAFAQFIEQGHLERHIQRMRRIHAGRREALLQAIHQHLGHKARVVGTNAGIHLILRLPELNRPQLQQMIERAAAAGIGVYDAAGYYQRRSGDAELILGYTAISEPGIRHAIATLSTIHTDLLK